jgi:tetratricopeptide (TPR) repeat protein
MEEVCKDRKALWAAHLSAIPRFPLAGTGAGTHSDVYRAYLAEHFPVEFTHGENGYLHLLLETGFVGLTIMLAGAALAGFWCIRTLMIARDARHTVAAAALLSGLAASLVHSVGDFVWYIPACFSLTLVVAACACRLYQLVVSAQPATADARDSRVSAAAHARRRRLLPTQKLAQRLFTDVHETRLARPVWLLATAGCVILAAVMLANRVPAALAAPHWDAYFTANRTGRVGVPPSNQQDAERTKTMVRHLGALLERDRHHARAQVRLAGLLLRMFDQRQQTSENPMPLNQVRDAALASRSHFSTREDLDGWLTKAIRQNNLQLLNAALDHARRAVRLCPLQGEGYVYLAELSFLEGPSATGKQAYIAQAMRVRPHTGVVLLAAGREALLQREAVLEDDIAKALALWKEAFHVDPECRTEIVEWFFPKNVTADQFITKNLTPDSFIKAFAPDRAGLGQLYYHYLSKRLPEHARSVAPRYAGALEADAKRQDAPAAATPLWGEAAGVYKALGDLRREEQCLGEALACTPDDLALRRRLADLLCAAGRYEEAINELRRLLSRNPDDQALRQQLEIANRQRLNSGTNTTRQ